MDVGILTGSLSPYNHRSTAVASHGLIRLLLACFCSFAERSRFNRIDPKHYLPQAYSMRLSALTTQSARLEGNAWAGQNAARFIAFECLPSPSTTLTNDITLSPSLSPVSSVPTSSPQTFVCCNPPRMIFYCFCQEEQCYLWLSVVFFVLCPSVTIKCPSLVICL